MTELFGGFSTDFYSGYRDEFPLDAGYATRKHLYNLYHVLNHLNLFGGSYGAQAERMIEQLLAQVQPLTAEDAVDAGGGGAEENQQQD